MKFEHLFQKLPCQQISRDEDTCKEPVETKGPGAVSCQSSSYGMFTSCLYVTLTRAYNCSAWTSSWRVIHRDLKGVNEY
jgi:hypothetical protein